MAKITARRGRPLLDRTDRKSMPKDLRLRPNGAFAAAVCGRRDLCL
jgi:hypothetical protein